jgi:3-methyladenine DNA glycosylase AlkD
MSGASLADTVLLLKSRIHEERLFALLLFLHDYLNGDDSIKKKICYLYIKNTQYINNWDLVDLSAPNIIGDYLANKSRRPLYVLAKSQDL